MYAKLLPIKIVKEDIKMAVLKRAKKSTSSNVKPMFSEKDISKLACEYADISTQIKQLEEKKKDLASKIKDGAEQFGVKDDKGSFYLEDDSFIMGKVARKTFKIDQDKAVETLESMGLGDVVDIVTMKTVNEDRLQKAVQEKRLTLDTVQDFTKENVSYSVLVKEKEAMPEVEVSTSKVARKK